MEDSQGKGRECVSKRSNETEKPERKHVCVLVRMRSLVSAAAKLKISACSRHARRFLMLCRDRTQNPTHYTQTQMQNTDDLVGCDTGSHDDDRAVFGALLRPYLRI